jgi:NAD(P)H-hydrate repair Nnr-like enzyme with NAD(P)H-hydrate epimerase domain
MDKAHNIERVSFSGTIMHLRVDGKDYQIDIAAESERLRNATQEQRENLEIFPAGYGIHWPDVDEDLSIDGLIGVSHAPPLVTAKT